MSATQWRFPPDIDVDGTFDVVGADLELTNTGPRRSCAVCANDDDCMCPVDLDTVFAENRSDDPHLNAMCVILLDAVHEALEWTTRDGHRFADPHPADEPAAWSFLHDELAGMLTRYRERFPARTPVS